MEIQLSSLSLAYVEAQVWLNWKLLSNPKQGLSQIFKKTCLKQQSKNLRLSWLHNYWVIFKVLNGKVCFLEKFGKCKYDFTHKGAPPPPPPSYYAWINIHQSSKLCFFFREPYCIFKSYLKAFCIETTQTSTSLGSLQKFEGALKSRHPPPPYFEPCTWSGIYNFTLSVLFFTNIPK